MSPAKTEDWKKRLKALGVVRKKRPKSTKREDFLRREEGAAPAGASRSPAAAPPLSSPFKEIPGSPGALRTSQKLRNGLEGEEAASFFLEEKSLRILARNVRYPDGELDIVALDGKTTVFVEVKRRRTVALGAPAEAVGRVKRARVVRAALRWLAAHPGRGRRVRFDVVAIVDDPPSVTWIADAFGREGPA